MASSVQFLLLLFSLFSFTNALVLPVTKDVATLQYVTEIRHATPLLPIKLVIDLGGPFLWTDCASRYASSSTRPIPNRSIECSRAKSHDHHHGSKTSCISGDHVQTCQLFAENRITRMATRGELVEDIIAVQSAGPITTVDGFLFTCAPTFLLNGLASGARGMLGLGRSRISLPSQISTAFDSDQKFSICLSSSNGIIVFGQEISRSLIYTPLVADQGENSLQQDYFINVKSIKINGKRLSLDGGGVGGTKLSTIVPYTTMESSIYATFIEAYSKAAASMNMTRAASVSPFGLCFNSKGVDTTKVGPQVPEIDLMLQSEMVKWRIFGRNSIVRISDEVMCLGFLNGGLNPRAKIVLGGYQLEDILLQFDLGTSMLGFSPSLLTKETTCSDFKLDSWPKESL